MRIPNYVLPLIPGSVWRGSYELLSHHSDVWKGTPNYARHIYVGLLEIATLTGIGASSYMATNDDGAMKIVGGIMCTMMLGLRALLSIWGRNSRQERRESGIEARLIEEVFE